MSIATMLLLAVGVSADAFAVALGKGLQMARLRWGGALAIALTFGVFQAVMPLIGWALASRFADYVTSVDHWIAFGLLSLIGAKMIHEALSDEEDEGPDDGHIPLRELLLLGVATSIDALAAGISLAFLDADILTTVLLIGVITFALSFAGVVIGHRAGVRWRGPAEIVGGLVLIAIGVRVLLSHLGVW